MKLLRKKRQEEEAVVAEPAPEPAPVWQETLSLSEIRERYRDVNRWAWKGGVLVDAETLQQVDLNSDLIAHLPNDILYLIKKLNELSHAYDALRRQPHGETD